MVRRARPTQLRGQETLEKERVGRVTRRTCPALCRLKEECAARMKSHFAMCRQDTCIIVTGV